MLFWSSFRSPVVFRAARATAVVVISLGWMVAHPVLSFGQSNPFTLAYSVTGSSSGQFLGRAVACLPQFASSTSASLAIGSPDFAPGGRIDVIDGPTGQVIQFQTFAVDTSQRLGASLAWAPALGFNPAGFGALIFGAPSSIPSINPAYCQVAGGPDGSSSFSLSNPSGSSSRVGFATAALFDDSNANGLPDYIYSAPDASAGGAVFIEDIASTAPIQTFFTSLTNEQFGASVISIADLDNDGVRDLLVGAPDALNFVSVDTGRVAALSSTSGNEIFQIFGDSSLDNFGTSLVELPDLNGDGRPEFLVGAPSGDAVGPGFARLFSPANPSSPLCTLSGSIDGDLFGASVAYVGDIDADGSPEFTVGAPGVGGGTGSISFFTYNTGTSSCSLKFVSTGSATGDAFGHRIAGSYPSQDCDFNGDGGPDFAVAAPSAATGFGRVFVFSGLPPPAPTPTPTATPTPLPPPSRATLTFQILASGRLAGTIGLNRAPTSPCRMNLYGRTTWSDRSRPGALMRLIERRRVASSTTRFSARGLRRALCAPNGEPFSLHVLAEVTCASKTFYSNVMARQTACGLRPPLTIRAWESALQSGIQ